MSKHLRKAPNKKDRLKKKNIRGEKELIIEDSAYGKSRRLLKEKTVMNVLRNKALHPGTRSTLGN